MSRRWDRAAHSGAAPALETERLRLLPWSRSDVTAFLPIAQDPEVMRFINDGTPWTAGQARAFVDRQARGLSERGYCRWKLVTKRDGALIGFCGAEPLTQLPDIEIGWWLARKRWGQGLATEAARVALLDLRQRIGLTRVVSLALREHARSIRIMQQIGLVLDRELTYNGFACVLYATPAPSVEP